jgi:Uncharacterized protein conserved in bacteria C-term(DUF2220)
MLPDASNSSVRLGRKLVHGRRVQPVAAVEEAQSVLARLPGDSARSARSLLQRALASQSIPGIMVRPQEENAALVLAACGVLRLEEKAEGDAAVYHWRPYRAALADGRRDEVRILLGKLDPDEARAGLLHAVAATPELSRERELLSQAQPGTPLRVPERSATQAGTWSVYDAALRAAAGWHHAQRNGQPLSARELAATSLGWSKAWTEPRMLAFGRVIGMEFDDALETMEPEVRLRGPLSWTAGTTAVDARVARPWVSIPARSAQQYGTLDYSQAEGVLVIENLDTFEAICRHSTAPDTWLCLWGHGYVNNSLTGLVKAIDRATACWADLDAHGINIVGDLQRRSERPVSPIFMEAALHDEFAFLDQDDKQVSLALDLAVTGHPDLRPLAARIAATRLGREQETMHHLIPKLYGHLLLLAGQESSSITLE